MSARDRRVVHPLGRLLAFCREEYAYYDGIADADPDHVLPVDALATIAMNSYINKAAQVRRIHRGLAARCDLILPEIPHDADLLAFRPAATGSIRTSSWRRWTTPWRRPRPGLPRRTEPAR
jgi:hypothetical protein